MQALLIYGLNYLRMALNRCKNEAVRARLHGVVQELEAIRWMLKEVNAT
jgi:hypothetical protein